MDCRRGSRVVVVVVVVVGVVVVVVVVEAVRGNRAARVRWTRRSLRRGIVPHGTRTRPSVLRQIQQLTGPNDDPP